MKFILAISFTIIGVHGYHDTIEQKQDGSCGAPRGDLMIQRITTAYNWINHIFWWEEKKSMICTDKIMDLTHRWYSANGEIVTRYYKELSGEPLIFSIPMKEDDKKGIVGSNQNLRIISFSNDEKQFNISEPVLELKDKGYCMHKAHCDKEGNLFIISNYKIYADCKGGILYRVKDKVAEKVEQFKSKIDDFVFSTDYKKMFIICDYGKIIAQYDFDMENGKISNHKSIFNVTEVDEGSGCSMTSIEIDNKENFWVTADDGIVMRIDKDGKVTKIVKMPFTSLTCITFGGYKNKNLIVGSKQEGSPEIQAGSVLLISGLSTKGIADMPVKW